MNYKQTLLSAGHIDYPFGVRQNIPDNVLDLAMTHPVIEAAIASYQNFMLEYLEPLCLLHHNRPASCDGSIGPATQELLAQPRCGHPDYGENIQAAIGTGNWKGCHNIGNFHSATVYVHDEDMPEFLAPIFDKVWERMVGAYAELGLKYSRVDNEEEANIDLSFVRRAPGWIGLAVVGSQQSCSSQIWCKFLATYHPDNVLGLWTELLMHELGHNAGLQHSRGGIMNPSIMKGLPASWKGDPSEHILRKLYGGVPIPHDGLKEYWITQCLKSNRGREVCVPLIPPILVEDN